MSEFIFMLTQGDRTIPDAQQAYESVRHTSLSYVGFKDVGSTPDTTDRLVSSIKSDGRTAVFEVVGLERDEQVTAARSAAAAGFDIVMGGTYAAEIGLALLGTDVRYFPFPGRIVGHPSTLVGSLEEIADSAQALCLLDGVSGLDLLAYRWAAGDVEQLIRAVVQASDRPVVIAGSIDTPERVRAVCSLGVWAFTVGSAIFDGSFAPGSTVAEQVELALLAAASPTSVLD